MDVVLDGRNCAARKDLNEKNRNAQKNAVHDGGADSHSRAHGQGQPENRVFRKDAVNKQLGIAFLSVCQDLSPPASS
jgi:hypothetical protein